MSVFNGNQIIDGNKVKFWLTRLRFYSMKTNVNKCWLNGEKNNSRKDSCNNTAYKRCVNGERDECECENAYNWFHRARASRVGNHRSARVLYVNYFHRF